ncbi:uncharacterized protein LTR77_005405 [Saxophila tyrrhenica]|uniref:Uncharacterized protein n=1 Tax=Saxophila tyrrhenica TaxID=1690608 RepID=A0AAV9PBE4_9PEZI|nr:hypothetical protein LTR77_005405 [Saxophila tyrrhenica]
MSSMGTVFSGYRERLTAFEEQSKNRFKNGIAWVEGEFVPLMEARIPLIDQGFMHSDLTYDVPSVWDGRYFRLDDHLDRVERSCTKMRMKFPIPRSEVRRILIDMVVKGGMQDAFVEIIVTRGLEGMRECIIEGKKPEDLKNSLYIFAVPYVWVMPPEMQLMGGDAIIARSVRRVPPGSFDPTIKNLQWGDLTRGILEAIDRKSTYPFLTDGDANITEGSGYNICFIKDGSLYTPDRGVLEGITRKSVFDAARAHDIPIRLEVVPVEMAYQCDECFMCTTAGGVMPITTMDGQPVNGGNVGPLTKKIWDTYWEMHWDDKFSSAIDYTSQASGAVNGVEHEKTNGTTDGH